MNKRQQIVDAVGTAFGGIKAGAQITVEGSAYYYQTSLGASRPFLRRLTPLEAGEPFMLAVHPGLPEIESERAEFGLDRYRLPIVVEIAARGASAAEICSAGWDDIRQTVRANRRWGGLARTSVAELRENSDDFRAQLAAQQAAGIAILITIDYTTNSGEV